MRGEGAVGRVSSRCDGGGGGVEHWSNRILVVRVRYWCVLTSGVNWGVGGAGVAGRANGMLIKRVLF